VGELVGELDCGAPSETAQVMTPTALIEADIVVLHQKQLKL